MKTTNPYRKDLRNDMPDKTLGDETSQFNTILPELISAPADARDMRASTCNASLNSPIVPDSLYEQDVTELKERLDNYCRAVHNQHLSDQATDRLMQQAASADARRTSSEKFADDAETHKDNKQTVYHSHDSSVSRRKFVGFALGAAAVVCAGLILSPFGPFSITSSSENGFVLKAYAQDTHASSGAHPINVATFTLHEAGVEYEAQLSHITCEFNLELAEHNVRQATYTLGDYSFTDTHQPQITQAYAAFKKRESEFPKESIPADNPWFVSSFTANMNDQTSKSAVSDVPVFEKRLYIQAPFSEATKDAAEKYFGDTKSESGADNSSPHASTKDPKWLIALASKDLFDLLEKTPLDIEVTYQDGTTEHKSYLIKLTEQVKAQLTSNQMKNDGFTLTEKDIEIIQM